MYGDANCTAGINMEHSPLDGHTLLRLATEAYEGAVAADPNSTGQLTAEFRELEWLVTRWCSTNLMPADVSKNDL